MSKVVVDIEPEFLSQYDKLPKEIKKKFKKQLGYLKENPKHKSLQIHRIQGTDLVVFSINSSTNQPINEIEMRLDRLSTFYLFGATASQQRYNAHAARRRA